MRITNRSQSRVRSGVARFGREDFIMPTEDNGSAVETIATLLRQRLGNALPMDQMVVDSLLDLLHEYRRNLLPLSGRPLGELVLSPTTDIAVIQAIKDHGKQLVSRPGCRASEQETALAIYFATIARALVFHSQKITSHSYESPERSFGTLMGKPWISPQLAELFAKAQRVCKNSKP
jgi:hypothetical protein